jgi:hypothetical protein
MKKILVIDDTQANLDTAKAFFSTIPNFEFVYVTDRQEAEKHFEEAYAVITDRSLPYSATSLIGCDFPEEETEDVEALTIKANGYFLLLKALLLGKPAIMASEHGGLMIMNGTTAPSKQIENFSLEETLQRISTEPTYEDMDKLWTYGNHEGTHITRKEETMKAWGAPQNILKTEEVAWRMVWEELQKQF